MNNNKALLWKTVLVLFYVNFAASLYAHDLDLPANNADVISSFYTDTLSLLAFMDKVKMFDGDSRWDYNDDISLRELFNDNYHNSIPFYFSAYVRAGLQGADALGWWQYNASLGSVIRINDYFSIPLYFSAVGAEIEDNSTNEWRTSIYNSLYTGGGLIFSCKYGTLGAFAGYYNFWGDASFNMNKLGDDEWQNHLKYGIIPVLDTTQYPFVKYVLKGIQTYLSFDFDKSRLDLSGYTTKIISRSIPIIEDIFSINSIYYVYTDQYLSAAAKMRGHGGGITLGFLESYKFLIEYEAGINKVYEAVPDILRYSSFNGIKSYEWYHSFFVGFKMDIITAAVIVRMSQDIIGNSISFVANFPVIKTSGYDYTLDVSGAPAGSFRYRKYQEKN